MATSAPWFVSECKSSPSSHCMEENNERMKNMKTETESGGQAEPFPDGRRRLLSHHHAFMYTLVIPPPWLNQLAFLHPMFAGLQHLLPPAPLPSGCFSGAGAFGALLFSTCVFRSTGVNHH